MLGYIIFILSMGIAVSCISYETIARERGWAVGEICSQDASLPKIIAFVTIIWILGKSFMVFNWWSPIVIFITGWLLAFIMTMALKKNIQFISILGIFPSLFFAILYISEEKPFGMLHQLFS